MSKPHLRYYVEQITLLEPVCPTRKEYEMHQSLEPTKILKPYEDIVKQWEKLVEEHVEGSTSLSFNKMACVDFDYYQEHRDTVQTQDSFRYWIPTDDVDIEWVGDEVFKK